MSNLSDAAYAKEMEAQKKRAAALKHLQTTGCGPTDFEATLADRGAVEALANRKPTKTFTTDNTLEQVRKQKMQAAQKSTDMSSIKCDILRQQEEIRKRYEDTNLPPDWKALVDEGSGKPYYWNVKSNETRWDKPALPTSTAPGNIALDELPPGWVEVVHSATQQKYYVHQGTGEKRWTRPLHTTDTSDIPDATAKKAAERVANDARRRPSETEAQRQEKRRRLTVDPLDPTGGLGKWSAGIGEDGKMADSTASGPLWQQRPYPAPGEALRNKPKQTASSNIGPTAAR